MPYDTPNKVYFAAQKPGDMVKGYVGMRKISLGHVGRGNHLRPMLNNEFIFQLGFLDQVAWNLYHDLLFYLGLLLCRT